MCRLKSKVSWYGYDILCCSLPKTLQMGKINNQLLHFLSDLFIEMSFGNGIPDTLNFKIVLGGMPPDRPNFGGRYVLSSRTPSKSHATPLIYAQQIDPYKKTNKQKK